MKTQIRIATLSLLAILCLTLAVVPATAGTLYSNGSFNGDQDAFTINFGYSVSDSFVVPSKSEIQDLHFIYWDASSTDKVSTVDMAIGSTSFGGTFLTLLGATNDDLGTNAYGYELFQANFKFTPTFQIPWSGAGFVTLQNACTTSGCDTNPIYWDENFGLSTAYDSALGTIPSEAFTLTGSSGGGTTPEPSSLILFGSGVIGLAGILRRRLMG